MTLLRPQLTCGVERPFSYSGPGLCAVRSRLQSVAADQTVDHEEHCTSTRERGAIAVNNKRNVPRPPSLARSGTRSGAVAISAVFIKCPEEPPRRDQRFRKADLKTLDVVFGQERTLLAPVTRPRHD